GRRAVPELPVLARAAFRAGAGARVLREGRRAAECHRVRRARGLRALRPGGRAIATHRGARGAAAPPGGDLARAGRSRLGPLGRGARALAASLAPEEGSTPGRPGAGPG